MRRGNGGGRGEEQWKINRGEVFGIIGLRTCGLWNFLRYTGWTKLLDRLFRTFRNVVCEKKLLQITKCKFNVVDLSIILLIFWESRILNHLSLDR